MSSFRGVLAPALLALDVTSPNSYAWFGVRARRLPAAVAATFPAGAEREYLIRRIANELYRSLYVRGVAAPPRPEPAPRGPDPDFVAVLSEANAGHGGWDPGWRVVTVLGATTTLVRDGLSVRTPLPDCRPAPTPGAVVSMLRPAERRAASPGFYLVDGDAARAGGYETRLYFHLTAAGAAPLVAHATSRLNAAGIPFTLKVIDHPERFSRCDAGVLYLDRTDFARARDPLRALVAACAPNLRAAAPAFTRPLVEGVAVAEHRPEDGLSFGTSRCRLVAEGAVDAYERGVDTLEGRIDAVARCFAARGLNLDRAHLAGSSRDRYAL